MNYSKKVYALQYPDGYLMGLHNGPFKAGGIEYVWFCRTEEEAKECAEGTDFKIVTVTIDVKVE